MNSDVDVDGSVYSRQHRQNDPPVVIAVALPYISPFLSFFYFSPFSFLLSLFTPIAPLGSCRTRLIPLAPSDFHTCLVRRSCRFSPSSTPEPLTPEAPSSRTCSPAAPLRCAVPCRIVSCSTRLFATQWISISRIINLAKSAICCRRRLPLLPGS